MCCLALAAGFIGPRFAVSVLSNNGGTTLVVLMGVETLPVIAEALVAAGRDVDTPLACVMDGGLPTQAVIATTLGAVAKDGTPAGLRPPAVTVIGPVARFAAG